LTPTTLKIKYEITWDDTFFSPNAAQFNLATTTETWDVTFKVGNETFIAEGSGTPAPASLNTVEGAELASSFTILSSSEIPSTSDAARFDTLTSRDVFKFESNLLNSGTEFFSLTDALFGRYVPPTGSQLITWSKTRQISSPQLIAGTVAHSTAGVKTALSNKNYTYEVSDNFLNNALQTAYSKTGTARVVSITEATTTPTTPAPASCKYVVYSDWGTGFNAAVIVKNKTNQPITGWQLKLTLLGGGSISQIWGARILGNAPTYTASFLSWNETIWPDQEITFGFNGVKTAGQSAAANVSGGICQ
ncbi:MAG TPA: cellulose binding domain-containing protein, partial [Cellvibrionaceae bacterium]